jgi:hypothetical protein
LKTNELIQFYVFLKIALTITWPTSGVPWWKVPKFWNSGCIPNYIMVNRAKIVIHDTRLSCDIFSPLQGD